MKKIITALMLLSMLLMGATEVDAKSKRKTKAKSTTTTVNYKFQETEDGFKSPIGHTYVAKYHPVYKNEICNKIVINFQDSNIVKITFYTTLDSEDTMYYAWSQDENYIFISDNKDPLKISENGKTLESVNTGLIYNITK